MPINPEELLFVVDENNNPLEPKPRSFAHKKGLWHKTTAIWIINSERQILCQKRSSKKDIKPGYWEAFFGGHVLASEDYLQNAVGELKEELGVEVNSSELLPFGVFKNETDHNEQQMVFGLKKNFSLSDFTTEPDEVEKLEWLDIGMVRNILLEKRGSRWVRKYFDKEVLDWLDSL